MLSAIHLRMGLKDYFIRMKRSSLMLKHFIRPCVLGLVTGAMAVSAQSTWASSNTSAAELTAYHSKAYTGFESFLVDLQPKVFFLNRSHLNALSTDGKLDPKKLVKVFNRFAVAQNDASLLQSGITVILDMSSANVDVALKALASSPYSVSIFGFRTLVDDNADFNAKLQSLKRASAKYPNLDILSFRPAKKAFVADADTVKNLVDTAQHFDELEGVMFDSIETDTTGFQTLINAYKANANWSFFSVQFTTHEQIRLFQQFVFRNPSQLSHIFIVLRENQLSRGDYSTLSSALLRTMGVEEFGLYSDANSLPPHFYTGVAGFVIHNAHSLRDLDISLPKVAAGGQFTPLFTALDTTKMVNLMFNFKSYHAMTDKVLVKLAKDALLEKLVVINADTDLQKKLKETLTKYKSKASLSFTQKIGPTYSNDANEKLLEPVKF
jgi:hypothetical protein